MPKLRSLALPCLLSLVTLSCAISAPPRPEPPKLLVLIGVDQFQAEAVDNVAGLLFPEDKAGFAAGALGGAVEDDLGAEGGQALGQIAGDRPFAQRRTGDGGKPREFIRQALSVDHCSSRETLLYHDLLVAHPAVSDKRGAAAAPTVWTSPTVPC